MISKVSLPYNTLPGSIFACKKKGVWRSLLHSVNDWYSAYMRIMLEEDLAGCNTLEVVQRQAQETLRYFQNIGHRVVYVAGPISADGEAHIQRNIDRLIAARGDLLRQLGGRAVPFTAPFIFTPEVYERLDIFSMDPNVREAKMQAFWDELLLSGVVDDVYLAPGWERSAGARKERETAELAGIPVYQMFG